MPSSDDRRFDGFRERARDTARAGGEEGLLGELAIQWGLIGREQLDECLREQREEAVAGRATALGGILVRRRLIDASGLTRLLREQRARAEGVPSHDRYEIDERVGEGAAAVVYRAIDRELGRIVALKVLRPAASTNTDVRDRFRREVQVAAGLAHPNIVTVYDAGETGGRLFLVMEYIDGRPLEELIALRDFALPRMLHLIEKVARAVGAAHAKGIVHRDLKPANVLVTREGEPKVADFGLAHIGGAQAGLTRAGTVMGTPLYMAPEQVRGRPDLISPRTDVYALGAVIYEVLTGRPPHAGQTISEIYAKILSEEPAAPRRLNPAVPRDLETVVLRALQKDPAARYADAGELADELRRWREGEPVLARPPGPAERAAKWFRSHRAATGLGAGLLAGLAILVATQAWRLSKLHGDIERLADRAQSAENEQRFADALTALEQLRLLAPDHPRLPERIAAMRDRMRRQSAREFIATGQAALRDQVALAVRLAEARARLDELRGAIPPHAAGEQKRALWDAEAEVEDLAVRKSRAYIGAVAAFTSALGADPQDVEARAALAGIYFRDLEQAEADGDVAAAAVKEQLVRVFDDGTYAPRLAPAGSVTLDSNPPTATAYVFRYEPGRDRRLMPRPFHGSTRAPERESTDETAYALEFAEFNRVGACPVTLALPSGSYLVVLRLAGLRDTRYPVLVGRGTSQRARVALRSDEHISLDFVHVPAGPFLKGGDPLAADAASRRAQAGELPDFCISRFELTTGEYLEFLNDRAHHDVEHAIRRAPQQPNTAFVFGRAGDKFFAPWSLQVPVMGISFNDALAYCAWRSDRESRGGSQVAYRLPTLAEWEKAARGVDGRLYPWGATFDWSFAKGALSRADPPGAEPVGTFTADESPYGVRDMSGGMTEWCAEPKQGDDVFLAYGRGGHWCAGADFIARFRTVDPAPQSERDFRSTAVGIRLVRETK